MAHRVSPQTTRWELEHKPWDTNLSNNEILPLPHILIGFSKGLKQQGALVRPRKNPHESSVFQVQSGRTVILTRDSTVSKGNRDIFLILQYSYPFIFLLH